jgi:rhamnosyl/mannosyltransferase
MRIGVVTHYTPPHLGGVELIAETLCADYRARGFEVRWLASRVPPSAPRTEDYRVRVGAFNLLEERLGIPVPLWGPEGVRELRALVQWADIVHVHDCLYPGSALAVFLANRRQRPVLLTQHIGFVPYRSPVLMWIQSAAYLTLGRAVLRAATRVVLETASAEAIGRRLLGYRAERCERIPYGVDVERFRPPTAPERADARAGLGLSADRAIALFVGRFVEKKGVHVLPDVVRLCPDIDFLFVGDGPLAHVIPRDRPNVFVKPPVSSGAMTELYWAADALILTSRGEGLPLVVQEAMSCGLPAIVSQDEPYVAALVCEGACVAVDRTPEAIARALREAIDPTKIELRSRGRAYAEAHWSLSTMGARYAAVLDDLAARSG